MGNDYYVTNEHLVHEDGTWTAAGEIFGYYVITHQYFERYRLPVMHTETNLMDAERARAGSERMGEYAAPQTRRRADYRIYVVLAY
jgi:hypothetical protein